MVDCPTQQAKANPTRKAAQRMTLTENPPTTAAPAPTMPHTAGSHTLNVPATRGKMGNTVFYTANFPLGMVVKLFTFDPEKMAQLPVEQRSQRALKKQRIPEITEYILGPDYFFSSLTVSVDANWLEFVPSELSGDVGVLKLPMETDWVVNDGQHRVAGVSEAIRQDPTLRNDTISVVILPDAGLFRSQQIFSDLNRNVQKTSKSLDILFDHRSPLNRIATHVVDTVRLFKGRTDKERVSLSANSALFATLAGVQVAVATLLSHVKAADLEAEYDKYEALVTDFWEYASTLIEPWQDIANGTVKPAEARVNYISSYQMMIGAVGNAGGAAFVKGGDWKKTLSPLKKVDWRKSNPEWQGLVMIGPEVVTRVTTRKALADYLRWKVGSIPDKPAAALTVGSAPAPRPTTTTAPAKKAGGKRVPAAPKVPTEDAAAAGAAALAEAKALDEGDTIPVEELEVADGITVEEHTTEASNA